MRGECRDCTKHGHRWLQLSSRLRRCLRCGIRQRLAYYWSRNEQQGETWVPDDARRI